MSMNPQPAAAIVMFVIPHFLLDVALTLCVRSSRLCAAALKAASYFIDTGPRRPEGRSLSVFVQCFHVVKVWRPVGEVLPSFTHCGISFIPGSLSFCQPCQRISHLQSSGRERLVGDVAPPLGVRE